jgi:hypothetical protein
MNPFLKKYHEWSESGRNATDREFYQLLEYKGDVDLTVFIALMEPTKEQHLTNL